MTLVVHLSDLHLRQSHQAQSCRRVVIPKQGASLRRYMDFVQALAPLPSGPQKRRGGSRAPAKLEAHDGNWTMTVDNCVPKTLLRIYWPLARS